ncbi:sugar ABC transporter permease [Ktedonobacter sp. SOSP1-52]|uniref:carbohydrate ABC transporter permease n=1 Tax=Ktedonobacter sp. SOSP1-52 TaxID=2778366 RepID=UPI001914F1D0|nr:sugar ABC transporter permease [Ktedonobacter sp. SOSP1-52]GHO72128.1 sugar ABC transporter permease [Ktedonobacter sp. SOSP1-52]
MAVQSRQHTGEFARSSPRQYTGDTGARRNRLRRAVMHNVTGYLWLAPAIIFFTLFVAVPIVKGLLFAFERVDLINPPSWIGWANFHYVLTDPLFWLAWRNSLLFLAYGLVFGYLVPVILAIIVNELPFGQGFFRTLFYLPALLPPVAGSFLWKWIFMPSGGLVNAFLQFLHIPAQPFLNSTSQALPVLLFINIWGSFGGGMLLYIAALRGIPSELYEAAEIDGANILRRVWHITFPQIRFLMLITLITQIIAATQIFNEPFLYTQGGPVNSTTTVVFLIYNYAFTENDFGAAAALSLILFLALASFSIYYLYLMRRSLGLVGQKTSR